MSLNVITADHPDYPGSFMQRFVNRLLFEDGLVVFWDLTSDLLQTNGARSIGFSYGRSWIIPTAEQTSFIASWSNLNEWRDWMRSLFECYTKGILLEFTSTSAKTHLANRIFIVTTYRKVIEENTIKLLSKQDSIEEKSLKKIFKCWQSKAHENRFYRRLLTGPATFDLIVGMISRVFMDLREPKIEVMLCQDNQRNIQAVATLKIRAKVIELSTIVTNPSNVRSSRNPTAERCEGSGQAIMHQLALRCLKEKKDLQLNPFSSIGFYKTLGINTSSKDVTLNHEHLRSIVSICKERNLKKKAN